MAEFNIRPACGEDHLKLVELESRCFDYERISRRQFRYLLNRAHARVLVGERAEVLSGYVVVLFSEATSIARIYSIAVLPDVQGKGLGKLLMKAAESVAWNHRRVYMRLEVHTDNIAAINLYEAMGYHKIARLDAYYENHGDAWRLEKTLAPACYPDLVNVPYYEQSLDFTCGPSALMMAMNALDPTAEPSRRLELRIWREATTIFMTSGLGGCGPFGLGLAAANRGFAVKIYVTDKHDHLIDSVRSEVKKEVMRLVQRDMHDELKRLRIPVICRSVYVSDIEKALIKGGIPVVMISSWQIYGAREPHWVVVTGFDDDFVYVNDPFVDREAGESERDSIHMPILKDKFQQMARYGRVGLQALLVIYSRGR